MMASTVSTPYWGFAIDADHLYWTERWQGVASIPLAGGDKNAVFSYPASSDPTLGGLAIHGDSVYWADNSASTIMRANKDGHGPAPTPIVSTQTINFLAIDDTAIYWTDNPDGTVWKAPIGGGAGMGKGIASDMNGPDAIAIDEAYVYWINTTIWSVNRVSKTGEMRASKSLNTPPSGLAIDQENIYWGDHDMGSIWSTPLSVGDPVQIASGPDRVGAVAVDEQSIYWVIATTNGELRRMPKGGGAVESLGFACDPTICPSEAVDEVFLVLSAEAAFWSIPQRIVKIAK
jgi:sugar lactone lactonase YvrE